MTAQYLQEQAARAERLARNVLDKAACAALMGYARECRQSALSAPPDGVVQTQTHPIAAADSGFSTVGLQDSEIGKFHDPRRAV
jgi:hypothetical protein